VFITLVGLSPSGGLFYDADQAQKLSCRYRVQLSLLHNGILTRTSICECNNTNNSFTDQCKCVTRNH